MCFCFFFVVVVYLLNCVMEDVCWLHVLSVVCLFVCSFGCSAAHATVSPPIQGGGGGKGRRWGCFIHINAGIHVPVHERISFFVVVVVCVCVFIPPFPPFFFVFCFCFFFFFLFFSFFLLLLPSHSLNFCILSPLPPSLCVCVWRTWREGGEGKLLSVNYYEILLHVCMYVCVQLDKHVPLFLCVSFCSIVFSCLFVCLFVCCAGWVVVRCIADATLTVNETPNTTSSNEYKKKKKEWCGVEENARGSILSSCRL
ncbi:hypothetical protein MOQ_005225 [Trypanosoma cruzi marinkellei]|uniref:Uncharacterized protein n=1 Tax=Trypanosoma cruzi marinkellei TaxID=85056 RepID=K2M7D8_TRYCR|nr:hypothetical protein MOQ_005225 [Trypanosoma cruzi marinkellei]